MAWRRERMRNITDERVWEALNSIPRGGLLIKAINTMNFSMLLAHRVWTNHFQPSLVAYMTQLHAGRQ